jgi:hypothetical protein
MKKNENTLLLDQEACRMVQMLIRWGYKKEEIVDAYSELEDKDFDILD